MEPHFGRDFSGVRIHTGADAQQSAQELDARAYTLGNDIVFGGEGYSPQTPQGRGLLAHELTHVVQQSIGQGPGAAAIQRKPRSAAPLRIDVPELAAGETYTPTAKYPWQNEVLRESIYPYRDEMLSFFLQLYEELDLRKDPSKAPEADADEIRAERARVTARQNAVNDRLKEMLKRRVSKESMAWRQASQEWILLRDNLRYLPDPDKKPSPAVARESRIRWAAYKYARLGAQGTPLTHDERLGKVLDRFDADAGFAKYPEWLRYMVLHLSGMRYASAHGSWAPAVSLISLLKQDEVRSSVGRMSGGTLSAKLAESAAEIERERAALDPRRDKRRIRVLDAWHKAFARQKQDFDMLLGDAASPDAKRYAELARIGDMRAGIERKLDVEKDPRQYAVLLELLEGMYEAEARLEMELGSKLGKIRAVEERSRATLIEHLIDKALAALPKDEYEALAVLQKMQDAGSLPVFVWREIVRRTPLKHDKANADWEKRTDAELESMNRSDESTRRWKEILKQWLTNSTVWREKVDADLSLVTIQAVCDQIAEMSQRARGQKPTPGIGQKAAWFASTGSFQALDRVDQLKPGASLVFLEWTTVKPKEPVHIVRHDRGYALRNEDKTTLADGTVDTNGWTYHFDADGTVRRSRDSVVGTSADPAQPPPTYRFEQWMSWKHEAVVVETDESHGRIIMFETGPIGLRVRSVKGTVGAWDTYVGVAPGGNVRANIQQFLKDTLPGR